MHLLNHPVICNIFRILNIDDINKKGSMFYYNGYHCFNLELLNDRIFGVYQGGPIYDHSFHADRFRQRNDYSEIKLDTYLRCIFMEANNKHYDNIKKQQQIIENNNNNIRRLKEARQNAYEKHVVELRKIKEQQDEDYSRRLKINKPDVYKKQTEEQKKIKEQQEYEEDVKIAARIHRQNMLVKQMEEQEKIKDNSKQTDDLINKIKETKLLNRVEKLETTINKLNNS
jgi:hypothetical protein